MSVNAEDMEGAQDDLNKVLDALTALRALDRPDPTDPVSVEAWHREFQQILAGASFSDRADGLSRFAEDVEVALGEAGAGPPRAVQEPGGIGPAEDVWAKITGGSQAAGWTWTEQEADAAGGSWGDKANGRNSTDDGKAYLTRNIVEVTANTVVCLHEVSLATGGTEWRFEPPLPTPVTQYKGIFVNGDTRYEADWTRVTS